MGESCLDFCSDSCSVGLGVFRDVPGVRLEEGRGCSRCVDLGVLRDDLWGASSS